MSLEAALARASDKPAGRRPYFLEPQTEKMLAIAMTLAQELAVARARVDTLERLLERKGVLTRDEIERFEPTKDEAAERGLWTQEYLVRVLRIVEQEAQAATAKGDLASEEVSLEVSAAER